MNKAIIKIKKIHKNLAEKIRTYKGLRKRKFEGERSADWSEWKITCMSSESRYRHIAYCIGRGTEYDEIEKPRDENKLGSYDWKKIEEFKIQYKEMFDEANVCSSKQPEKVL